jgi:hypothetical protein
MNRIPVLLALFLPACIGVKVGNGVSATRSETFDAADGFRLATLVDSTVSVVPGAPASVDLTCDESLLHDFTIEVLDSGVLVIRDHAGLSLDPRANCFAEVTVPALESLEDSGSGRIDVASADGLALAVSSGSGSIDVGAVTSDFLEVDHSGSGRVTLGGLAVGALAVNASGSGRTSLSGTADSADIVVSGSGGVGEMDLVVGDLLLHVSGSGGAELTATDSADVTVTGSGGATIGGDPDQRSTTDSGSGNIHFD